MLESGVGKGLLKDAPGCSPEGGIDVLPDLGVDVS